jgi:hypothetical protein
MRRVAAVRSEIYDYYHGTSSCEQYFLDPRHESEFAGFYNSMYLLQDSTDALWRHRVRGFSEDALLAYLEFWGVMQAAIIQQDSIAELYELVLGRQLDPTALGLQFWPKIRTLRNECAGHPVRRDRPRTTPMTRTFMGRSFGDYAEITYERWENGTGITHPKVAVGALFDQYEVEAEAQLQSILCGMKQRWT